MISTKNLLKPASGEPMVGPSKDMVLGVYYLTMAEDGMKGEGRIFSDLEEVNLAYSLGQVHLHTKIKLLADTVYKARNERFADRQVAPRPDRDHRGPRDLQYDSAGGNPLRERSAR